jgi:hypothetical protein
MKSRQGYKGYVIVARSFGADANQGVESICSAQP